MIPASGTLRSLSENNNQQMHRMSRSTTNASLSVRSTAVQYAKKLIGVRESRYEVPARLGGHAAPDWPQLFLGGSGLFYSWRLTLPPTAQKSPQRGVSFGRRRTIFGGIPRVWFSIEQSTI